MDYKENEAKELVKILSSDFGNKVQDKVDELLKTTNYTIQQILESLVYNNVELWARVYLNWLARDYQIPILRNGKIRKRLTLRLGRRLGKTECMCILILWYAFTQRNKGANNQYDILIITPYDTQIDLIFTRLKQLLDSSPFLKSHVTRDIHHKLHITINGVTTIIKGLTAGSKSNSGANNTRGSRADLIVFDEVDYMCSNDITNVINIANEDPNRIKIIAASTPCGKKEEYYKWCVDATYSYRPSKDDIDNFTFNGYIESHNPDGNGWTEIFAPSVVNKSILEINPDTGRTFLEDLKQQLTEVRFEQEVMAGFGEQEAGVYKKKYLDYAIEEGIRIKHRYTTEYDKPELQHFLKYNTNKIILGVDWDRTQAGSSLCAVMLDEQHKNKYGDLEPMFKILFRMEIASGEFTMTNAVNEIIRLNDIYNFDGICVDRGYGDVQVEMLHKYGMAHPETGLREKVVSHQFGESIEIRDPHTYKKTKQPFKPYMVYNSVNVFEKCKMIMHQKDKHVLKQFEDYIVESTSGNGVPKFTDKNEHFVDAVNLALLMFEQKYGDLFKLVLRPILRSVGNLDKLIDDDVTRNIDNVNNSLDKRINQEIANKIKSSTRKSKRVQRKSNQDFSRSIF